MLAPDAESVALCEEGYAHLEACRFDAAIASLSRACQRSPQYALAHFRLALLYNDTGRYDAALAELDRAIALEPANGMAHNNRGSVLQMLERLPEAEQAFRTALGVMPHLIQPYTNLGHLLEREGKTLEALELYTEAIRRGLDIPLFSHNIAAIQGRGNPACAGQLGAHDIRQLRSEVRRAPGQTRL